jgi:hypothetical protein
MRLKHRTVYGIAISALALMLTSAVAVRATQSGGPPSAADVAFAQQVSVLLQNELVAALFQEFAETTPDNVAHGKQAISLIFNDLNRDIRLVGTFDPLGTGATPDGSFERRALQLALTGEQHSDVQKVAGSWYYRRSIPLSNSFHTACVLCHANFTPEFFAQTNNPGQWVGALMLRVPIGAP